MFGLVKMILWQLLTVLKRNKMITVSPAVVAINHTCEGESKKEATMVC